MVGYAPPVADGTYRSKPAHQEQDMGKGDKKTAKGKRYAGSYGNARPHGTTVAVTKKVAATPKAPVVAKKAPAKKKA